MEEIKNIYNSLFQGSSDGLYKKTLTESARAQFVQQVFSIVGSQLLITALFVYLGTTNRSFRQFQNENQYLLMASAIITLVIGLVFSFSQDMARQVPQNYFLLLAFTLAESYLVGAIVQMYRVQTVLLSLVFTGVMVFGMIIYSFVTKKDHTSNGKFLYSMMTMISVISLVMWMSGSNILRWPLQLASAVIVCLYFVYDVQLVMGGKRFEIGLDDYILASITLYIDVVRLFQKILSIMEKLENKKSQKEEK